jgi:hypothetical protein
MNSDPDRIAVPTNGRGPHAVPAVDDAASSSGSPGSPGSPASRRGVPPELDLSDDLSGPFSSRQMIVGFGIIASLVLLLIGRARRRR